MKSLAELTQVMGREGATHVYLKRLAPNDDSKHGIYLSTDLSAFQQLPHRNLRWDHAQRDGAKRSRLKADLDLYWLSESGLHQAPNAKLIAYPDYPEVRLSGMLRGCSKPPTEIVKAPVDARLLVLGVVEKPEARLVAYCCLPDDPVAKSARNQSLASIDGSTLAQVIAGGTSPESSRQRLIDALSTVHQKGWIPGRKLNSAGVSTKYCAPNAGGYTLEAELGVAMNSDAGPDLEGWELKQYQVKDFVSFTAKNAVSLLTPEPDGGVYGEDGFRRFIVDFGYADRRHPDRINFGGIYRVGAQPHPTTRIRAVVEGYDVAAGLIADHTGGFSLVHEDGRCAATWSLEKLIGHWVAKHAAAMYVPSLRRGCEFRYGPRILLGENSGPEQFIHALATGKAYLDPGSYVTATAEKRRNQFRCRHPDLVSLYERTYAVDLQ